MVVLSEELVLSKTRAEELAAVKNLNLWGSDLTDVSILQRMPNVEVLSLSVNKIRSLADFAYCQNLTELYLRKNEIADIREVEHLQQLKSLSILWLCDNPCVGASAADYRKRTIAMLPSITKLDNVDVTEDERAQAIAQFKDLPPLPSPSGPAPSNFAGAITTGRPVVQPVTPKEKAQPPPSPPPAADHYSSTNAPNKHPSHGDASPLTSHARAAPAPSPAHAGAGGGGGAAAAGGLNPLPPRPFGREGSQRSGGSGIKRPSNVLVAVMALIKELDGDALIAVQSEVGRQLTMLEQQDRERE